jgi:hypothetical protein
MNESIHEQELDRIAQALGKVLKGRTRRQEKLPAAVNIWCGRRRMSLLMTDYWKRPTSLATFTMSSSASKGFLICA